MAQLNITKANLMDNIKALEELGFKRWTKGSMDRMYINACDLGFDADSRTFKGEKISGSICQSMKSAKTYIDLKSYMVISDNCDLAYEVADMLGLDLVGGRCKYEIA